MNRWNTEDFEAVKTSHKDTIKMNIYISSKPIHLSKPTDCVNTKNELQQTMDFG